MNTFLTVTPEMLARSTPEFAIEIFRDMLWCHARRKGIPLSKVHISLDTNRPDGGIDASVDNDNGMTATDEFLTTGGSHYQIKAGKNAKPWQESWLKTELLGQSNAEVKETSLGAAVLRCLRANGRYVLACFGCDPLPEEIARAKEHLQTIFAQCGYSNACVDVWGQTTLISYLVALPSLCLKIAGRDNAVFFTHESWKLSDQMSKSLHLGDQQTRMVAEIRALLRGSTVRHIRIIGEPGLGKTRLVLEAVATSTSLHP